MMDMAKLVSEDFLQQNGYSAYDCFCPFEKTYWMLKNIIFYFENSLKALEAGFQWHEVRNKTDDVFYRLTRMKFVLPDKECVTVLERLYDDILSVFIRYF